MLCVRVQGGRAQLSRDLVALLADDYPPVELGFCLGFHVRGQGGRAQLSRDLVALLADDHPPALDLLRRCFPPGLAAYLAQPRQNRPHVKTGAATDSMPARAPPPQQQRPGPEAAPDQAPDGGKGGDEAPPRERAMSPGRAPAAAEPPQKARRCLTTRTLLFACGRA